MGGSVQGRLALVVRLRGTAQGIAVGANAAKAAAQAALQGSRGCGWATAVRCVCSASCTTLALTSIPHLAATIVRAADFQDRLSAAAAAAALAALCGPVGDDCVLPPALVLCSCFIRPLASSVRYIVHVAVVLQRNRQAGRQIGGRVLPGRLSPTARDGSASWLREDARKAMRALYCSILITFEDKRSTAGLVRVHVWPL